MSGLANENPQKRQIGLLRTRLRASFV